MVIATALSITIMEVVDNLVIVLVPGAMDAGLTEPLLYASTTGTDEQARTTRELIRAWR